MPSAVYALASDTLIGVVRVWAIARMRHAGQTLAGDDATPPAVAEACLLWLLRLLLAPASTLTGFSTGLTSTTRHYDSKGGRPGTVGAGACPGIPGQHVLPQQRP